MPLTNFTMRLDYFQNTIIWIDFSYCTRVFTGHLFISNYCILRHKKLAMPVVVPPRYKQLVKNKKNKNHMIKYKFIESWYQKY